MPESGTFLSVDPVESEPPYQYVRGNVVNRVDPSGYYPPPECKTKGSKRFYRDCVLDHYDLEPIERLRRWVLTPEEEDLIEGTPGCDLRGPILFRGPGYLEGWGVASGLMRFGAETVYDFATFERSNFTFEGGGGEEGWGGISDGILGGSYMTYQGTIEGFPSRPKGNIRRDYSGIFISESFGGDFFFGSAGILYAASPDGNIRSESLYFSVGLSVDPIPFVDIDLISHVNYTARDNYYDYVKNGKIEIAKLLDDISNNVDLGRIDDRPKSGLEDARLRAQQTAKRMAKIYEEIHSK